MTSDGKSSRQSFLGEDSQRTIESASVGVVGLGGGGSHVVQQLAHIGFQDYVLLDPDVVEKGNLNRLVGATLEDAAEHRPKTEVAKRVIHGLEPQATVTAEQKRWQNAADLVKKCDVVFGCLDGYSERAQLEGQTRRYLIPYIDIGMDVYAVPGSAPSMAGQVILSMPGSPCMQCMQFITESKLEKEAALYGAAGDRPQVVWPNGILASTAVGIAIDLLTDWTQALRGPVYMTLDGNRSMLKLHPRLNYAPPTCEHYPLTNLGTPQFMSPSL